VSDEQTDPRCARCGGEVNVYHDDPSKTICERCCGETTGHDFKYDKWRRGWLCEECDAERLPEDLT
jgi:hypothetical protein